MLGFDVMAQTERQESGFHYSNYSYGWTIDFRTIGGFEEHGLINGNENTQ
jgi:hypothetical protein